MSNYQTKQTRTDGLMKQLENSLAKLTGPNRRHAERSVQRRLNRGNAPATELNYVIAIRRFTEAVGGTDLARLSPDELADGVTRLRTMVGDASSGTYMVHVRNLLKDVLNTDELGRDVRGAMHAPDKPSFREGKVLSQEDFDAILQFIAQDRPHVGIYDKRMECIAIAWVLRDAGFRARELLAMNMRGVDLRSDGSGILHLPHDPGLQHMLKTGPREVAIKDATGPLSAWIDMHPGSDDPNAPLFPGFRSKAGKQRLGYKTLWEQVKRWGDGSGIDLRDAQDRTLRPHDFRHTCATMKVRVNGWRDTTLLENHFGWRPGSKMPARYVHMDGEAMRQIVLRDKGINDLGYKDMPNIDPKLAQAAKLLELLKESIA